MSAAGLARNLDVPTNRITAILHGQRSITGDTALRLGHFFGTAPEFWLNLQSIFELPGQRLFRCHPERTCFSGADRICGLASGLQLWDQGSPPTLMWSAVRY